jgi:membrane-bound ClpP family serine protease
MSPYFWPLVFLLITLAFMVLELFLPSGGMLGLVAVLCLLSGIVAAILNTGVIGGVLYLLACAILVPIMISLMLKVWPRTPIGKRILIQPPTLDQLLPNRQQQLNLMVGKTGLSISSMLPSGAIRIDGRLFDAVSDGMTIEKETFVKIVAVRGNHLVVRPTSPPESTKPLSNARPTVDTIIPDPFNDPLT